MTLNMDFKLISSGLAIILTFVAFVPYIRDILRGKTKPHVFSWWIWGLTTLIIFLAQVQDKGGIGAWPIGISGLITLYIALLAYLKRADISITRLDWIFFICALASIPAWYMTADPTTAVIVLTLVDLAGFGPTVRKAYTHPHDESVSFFLWFMIRNGLVILALENYSIATVLFPLSVGLACLLLIAMILYRRRSVLCI